MVPQENRSGTIPFITGLFLVRCVRFFSTPLQTYKWADLNFKPHCNGLSLHNIPLLNITYFDLPFKFMDFYLPRHNSSLYFSIYLLLFLLLTYFSIQNSFLFICWHCWLNLSMFVWRKIKQETIIFGIVNILSLSSFRTLISGAFQ